MRMRLSLMMIFLIAVLCAGPRATTTSAQGVDAGDRERIYAQTSQLLQRYSVRNDRALDQALQALGWTKLKLEPVQTSGEVGIMSAAYCGSTTPKAAYRQSNGTYLVVGQWRWVDSACNWASEMDRFRPEDGIAMGVTDSQDRAVNVPATRAGGNVFDEEGRSWPGLATTNYTLSSVGYALEDRDQPIGVIQNHNFAGHNGSVFFYLDRKPTTAGSHYLQVCWKHTWNSTSADLQSVEISYPWAVKLVIANSSGVGQWSGNGACSKALLVYQ